MEPPPVLPLHLLHSLIVNILITLCSGRTGKTHPNRRKIFNGRVNAGLLCARFSSKALIAITFRGDAFARASYGSNYDRLVALKNKYDRSNFFRMNHNIRPTT